MSIKRILVPLPGYVDHSGEIDMALSVGKALGAHVEALFISQPQPTRGGVNVEAITAYGGRMASIAPVNVWAEEREKMARDMHQHFVEICAKNGLRVVTAAEEFAPLTASWREAIGSYVEVAVQRAAGFDLVVAASATVLESLMDIAEQSLLQTHRPVLLAPTTGQAGPIETAIIAWDESPQCWYAVSTAIPFLQAAKTVHVVSVDRDAGRRGTSQAEVLAYLRCHGIAANAQVVAPHLRSVGDTLLAIASDHDAGLLVMGAYSHSRLREMLLGGATRHMLKNASARPVLLAH